MDMGAGVPLVPSQAAAGDAGTVKQQTERPAEESHRTSHFQRGDLGGGSLTEGGATIKNGSELPPEVPEHMATATLTADELGQMVQVEGDLSVVR